MKRTGRSTAILLVVVIFGVIAGVGLWQNRGTGSTISAQEYFQVMEAGVENGEIADNGTVYILYGISITFKAAKGDAHEVIVQSWGYGEPVMIGTMSKDVPMTIDLWSPRGVFSTKKTDGFYVTIRITSLEASGNVTFKLSE